MQQENVTDSEPDDRGRTGRVRQARHHARHTRDRPAVVSGVFFTPTQSRHSHYPRPL